MKTFDKKDVFSWSNAEEAKQYIGKDCYFAHSIGVLSEHIKTGVIGTLKDIFNSNHDAISCAFGDGTSTWGLCLPAEKVKEVEEPKKYRPFETIEEFVKTIGDIGTIITYRTKKEPSQEMKGMFTGYMWDSACRGWILGIGASLYRLENLFELAEYKHKNEWKPFGVEENE